MPKDNIKQIGFMDAFFLATKPRSTIRNVEQIAATEKARIKKLKNKTCKVNQTDSKKPAINNVEWKSVVRKMPEQVPGHIKLCTPCALFVPVYVSEIIFLHLLYDLLCLEKPTLLFKSVFPIHFSPVQLLPC